MRRSSPRTKRLRQLSLTEAFKHSSSKKPRKIPVATVEKVAVKQPKQSVQRSTAGSDDNPVIDLSDDETETERKKKGMKKSSSEPPSSPPAPPILDSEVVREKLAEAALKRATEAPKTKVHCSQESATSSTGEQLNGSQPLFSDNSDEDEKAEKGRPALQRDEIPGPSTSKALLPPPSSPQKDTFRGPPIQEFIDKTGHSPLPSLKPSKYHTVFIKSNGVSSAMSAPPEVFPPPGKGHPYTWDRDCVRMPCDTQHCTIALSKDDLATKWDLIQKALSVTHFQSTMDIEDAIKSYNPSKAWSFKGLRDYIQSLQEEEWDSLMKDTLPGMAKLALRLPHLITQDIPHLKSGYNNSLTFSQEQIACILANAFFCTWPSMARENSNYPYINFDGIFKHNRDGYAKLSCIFHYFRRVLHQMPAGVITYQRQCIKLEKMPVWDESRRQLCRLHVSKEGTIEDYGAGMLQMDFANCFIGGGVLGQGCVQEEIRFMICPELLASLLFTEKMADNESVFIIGAERFSLYCGYASTFEWTAGFTDETPRDDWGRRMTEVVAVDAIRFGGARKYQYSGEAVTRELNKLYSGFQRFGAKASQLSAVATGNWGCGVFGGDKELKSLIQIMAASETGRDLVYFTFDDDYLMGSLHETHRILKDKKLSVGDIHDLLMQYYEKNVKNGLSKTTPTIFEYIVSVFDPAVGNSDSDEFQNVEETLK